MGGFEGKKGKRKLHTYINIKNKRNSKIKVEHGREYLDPCTLEAEVGGTL